MADEQPPPPPWQSVKDAMRMREARSKDGKAVSNAPIRAYTKLQDLPLEEQKARRREQKRVSEQKRRARLRREEAEARRELGEEEAERQQQRQQQQLQQQHEQKRRDRVRREEAEARRKLGEEAERKRQQQHGALRAPSAVPQQQQPQSAAPHAAHTTQRDPSAHNAVRRVNDDNELQDSLSSFPGPPITLQQQQQQQQKLLAHQQKIAAMDAASESSPRANSNSRSSNKKKNKLRKKDSPPQRSEKKSKPHRRLSSSNKHLPPRVPRRVCFAEDAEDSDDDDDDDDDDASYESNKENRTVTGTPSARRSSKPKTGLRSRRSHPKSHATPRRILGTPATKTPGQQPTPPDSGWPQHMRSETPIVRAVREEDQILVRNLQDLRDFQAKLLADARKALNARKNGRYQRCMALLERTYEDIEGLQHTIRTRAATQATQALSQDMMVNLQSAQRPHQPAQYAQQLSRLDNAEPPPRGGRRRRRRRQRGRPADFGSDSSDSSDSSNSSDSSDSSDESIGVSSPENHSSDDDSTADDPANEEHSVNWEKAESPDVASDDDDALSACEGTRVRTTKASTGVGASKPEEGTAVPEILQNGATKPSNTQDPSGGGAKEWGPAFETKLAQGLSSPETTAEQIASLSACGEQKNVVHAPTKSDPPRQGEHGATNPHRDTRKQPSTMEPRHVTQRKQKGATMSKAKGSPDGVVKERAQADDASAVLVCKSTDAAAAKQPTDTAKKVASAPHSGKTKTKKSFLSSTGKPTKASTGVPGNAITSKQKLDSIGGVAKEGAPLETNWIPKKGERVKIIEVDNKDYGRVGNFEKKGGSWFFVNNLDGTKDVARFQGKLRSRIVPEESDDPSSSSSSEVSVQLTSVVEGEANAGTSPVMVEQEAALTQESSTASHFLAEDSTAPVLADDSEVSMVQSVGSTSSDNLKEEFFDALDKTEVEDSFKQDYDLALMSMSSVSLVQEEHVSPDPSVEEAEGIDDTSAASPGSGVRPILLQRHVKAKPAFLQGHDEAVQRLFKDRESNGHIEVSYLDTAQGLNTTNGCSMIVALTVHHHLTFGGLLDNTSMTHIVEDAGCRLPEFHKHLAATGKQDPLGTGLGLLEDSMEYLYDAECSNSLVKPHDGCEPVGGNILSDDHWQNFINSMDNSKEAGVSVYFKGHFVTLIKANLHRNPDADIKAQLHRNPDADQCPFAYDLIESLPDNTGRGRRIRCWTLDDLKVVVQQYALTRVSEDEYHDIPDWDESFLSNYTVPGDDYHKDPTTRRLPDIRLFQANIYHSKNN